MFSDRRLSSPSCKRARDEDEDKLEYADEEQRTGSPGRDAKRPRVEDREASAVSPGSSPKAKDKGKGRAFTVEDRLPISSSSFHMPPPPMPRFGPTERYDVYLTYKPAVPGYEPPQPPGADDEKRPGQHGGEGGDNRAHHQDTTQTPRGAPPPAEVQPKGPQQGVPWDVPRSGRPVLEGEGDLATDHAQMAPDLKQPVNWSMVSSQRPNGASYREWDDELEKQNPWHQGGHPVLKQ